MLSQRIGCLKAVCENVPGIPIGKVDPSDPKF